MIKKLFLSLAFAAMPVCGIFAQNISNVSCRQEGNAIIVNYDIDKAADAVELYVSRDGGRSFTGPLKKISGDVLHVSRGHKAIRWDVLDEVDSFSSDKVVFEVRPAGTTQAGQMAVKPSPRVKFQFEIGGGYGCTYIHTRGDYDYGGLGPTIYASIGLLADKQFFAAEGRVSGYNRYKNGKTFNQGGESLSLGLRYRYTKNWRKGLFFGAHCGYDFNQPWMKIDAEIGYSFTKWLNIKLNAGYPRTCDLTLGINIANIFYK